MFAAIFREQFPLNLLISVTLAVMMGTFDNFQLCYQKMSLTCLFVVWWRVIFDRGVKENRVVIVFLVST